MSFDFIKNNINKKEKILWGDLLSLSMFFPTAITLGFFIGRLIGKRFGYTKVGIIIGLIWGIATGFWELYRVSYKINNLNKTNMKKNDKIQ